MITTQIQVAELRQGKNPLETITQNLSDRNLFTRHHMEQNIYQLLPY